MKAKRQNPSPKRPEGKRRLSGRNQTSGQKADDGGQQEPWKRSGGREAELPKQRISRGSHGGGKGRIRTPVWKRTGGNRDQEPPKQEPPKQEPPSHDDGPTNNKDGGITMKKIEVFDGNTLHDLPVEYPVGHTAACCAGRMHRGAERMSGWTRSFLAAT